MELKALKIGIMAICMIAIVSCREQEEATPTQSKTEVDANPKTSPSKNSNTAALNPAHGQPGHRCEIPVGAPLDGSGGTVTGLKPQNTNLINSNTSPVRLKTSTPAKNPPHGQPGHSCSVPVGADLN